MTEQEYKDMIHSIVVPATLSYEEQGNRYQPLLSFLQSETPQKLYRFRQCNELSMSAFNEDKLFFSPPIKLNDDFDSMLCFNKELILSNFKKSMENAQIQNLFSTIKQGGDLPAILQSVFSAEQLRVIKESLSQSTLENIDKQLNSFQVFVESQLNQNITIIEEIVQNVIRVACFSEAIESSAMWGYYADSSKGFALAYDFRDSSYGAQGCTLARVIYEDKRFDASEFAAWLLIMKILSGMGIILSSNNNLRLLFPCPDVFMNTKVVLHKADSWRHEAEWRLTFSGNSTADHPCIMKRPTAVYLGRRISTFHEKTLRHIAVEKGIPVYKMTIKGNDSAYRLHPEQIQ